MRLVGRHLSGIPKIADILPQSFATAAHENLKAGLSQTPQLWISGLQLPAQARLEIINPHRIDKVLAAQAMRNQWTVFRDLRQQAAAWQGGTESEYKNTGSK
jgi:hypothetical protein